MLMRINWLVLLIWILVFQSNYQHPPSISAVWQSLFVLLRFDKAYGSAIPRFISGLSST
jgi:hypothetical protein